MKKSLKFLLLIAPIALCGCDFNFSNLFKGNKDNQQEKESGSQTTDDSSKTPSGEGSDDQGQTTPGEDPVINDKITGMYMNGFLLLSKRIIPTQQQ